VIRIGLLAIVLASAIQAEPGPRPREVKFDVYGDALPDGALMRLGTVRWRHDGVVSSIAFSADEKSLLACSGRTFVEWDSATGIAQRKQTLSEDKAWLTSDHLTWYGINTRGIVRHGDMQSRKELVFLLINRWSPPE
jgi:hypothetical protein